MTDIQTVEGVPQLDWKEAPESKSEITDAEIKLAINMLGVKVLKIENINEGQRKSKKASKCRG